MLNNFPSFLFHTKNSQILLFLIIYDSSLGNIPKDIESERETG